MADFARDFLASPDGRILVVVLALVVLCSAIARWGLPRRLRDVLGSETDETRS